MAVWILQNEFRSDQNQSLEAKRPKVGSSRTPAPNKSFKNQSIVKIGQPGALKSYEGFAEKCKPAASDDPGPHPPHKYLSKLRYNKVNEVNEDKG